MLEAVILESSPRHKEWLEVFGTNRVPITGWMNADVLGVKQEVYRLDVASLSQEQLDRLAEHLARKFSQPLAQVRESILQDGVPIVAKDVYVPIDLRFVV